METPIYWLLDDQILLLFIPVQIQDSAVKIQLISVIHFKCM